MNVIGLGAAGCKIVDKLQNYAQYERFYIDTENNDYDNFYRIQEQLSHQEYEKNYKKINLKKCKGETYVVLSGSGNISGCVLRLLEQLKDNSLNVIYIKSDESPMGEDKSRKHKIVSQVLQQYARSGKLERIYLISNKMIESIIGELSIKNYWGQINTVIANTFHMCNIFANTEPLLQNLISTPDSARISTFGVVNYQTGDEKLFYDLKYPRAISYYYNLNDNTLENENDTLTKIRDFVESKTEEKISVGFSIYPTEYKENYIYCRHDASLIQEQNIK